MDKPGERSVLALAGGMAFLAGATDVYGLAKLHDLYVSFMSGNTTQLGVSLGGGDFARAGSIAVLIGLFVLGAAGGAVFFNLAGRFHTATVILIVSIILLEPIVIRDGTAFAFVLAMGLLNASISRVGAASVSLTFVTGALVKFGQGLGNWITGHRSERLWGLQALMWASLLAGSCAAAVLRNLGVVQPWPLPLAAFLLTVVAFALAPASTTLSRPASGIR